MPCIVAALHALDRAQNRTSQQTNRIYEPHRLGEPADGVVTVGVAVGSATGSFEQPVATKSSSRTDAKVLTRAQVDRIPELAAVRWATDRDHGMTNI